MYALDGERMKNIPVYAWSQTHGSQGGDLDVDEDETEESADEEEEGSKQ